MIKTLKEAVTGVWSMLVGLKITGTNFFQPQITVHYPRQVAPLEGYRGHIELVAKEDDQYQSKCVACGTCYQLCPSSCIDLRAKQQQSQEKRDILPPHPDMADMPIELKQKFVHPVEMVKEPEYFNLDYNYCSLCGLCVQNCPAGALRFSSDVYLAGYSRQEFEYDLMARLRYQAQKKEK